jgi:hypothetical protein
MYEAIAQHRLWMVGVAFLASACTKQNPDYCNTSNDCSSGEVCDPSTHGCIAGVNDAMTADGGEDAPPPLCDVNKAFGIPNAVVGLHDVMANDVHATLTGDERTVYFASNRTDYSTTMHIYTATRPTRDGFFGAPTKVAELASSEGENNPAILADGNTLYFDTYVTSAVVLLMSSRQDPSLPFLSPNPLPGQNLVEPSITADGNALYATNLQTGAIARLQRTGTTFAAAEAVDTQLAYTQVSPATSDELTLYLTVRNGAVRVTKRSSTTAAWPTPTEVAELGTHDEQYLPSWISPDGCRLYMTYTPTGEKSRVVMAARPL